MQIVVPGHAKRPFHVRAYKWKYTPRHTHIRINYMLKQQKATGRKMQKKCLTRRRNDLHCMIKGMAKNARGKKESRQEEEEVEPLAEPEPEAESGGGLQVSGGWQLASSGHNLY